MKLKQFYIIFFFLGIFSVISCNKKPFDYRNKYIGEWNFSIEYSSFNMGNSPSIYDLVEYLGEITYGEEDNNVIIKYSKNNSVTLTIDKNGIFYDLPTRYCNGTIVSDNIDLYLRWGGLGGGTSHKITGYKK